MGNKTRRQWTRKEAEAYLKKKGFWFLRNGKGSHKIYTNGKDTVSLQLCPNGLQMKRLFKELHIE